jgi:hypothetical protein
MKADVVELIRDTAPTPAIQRTAAVFDRWLYLPDKTPLYAVLGTIAANLLPGDPVWLMLVGPPGGGKSELLQSLTKLEYVRTAGTLTEASLLSGSAQKDKAKDARGGLLREIGDFGIVVAKDFGSILSLNRDARSQLLAALREVFDGSWTRLVGTDGGRTLHWEGKIGFIGGCTQSIDRHHAVIGAMGERFIYLRLPAMDAGQQALRAMEHGGREKQMRQELAAAVSALFEHGTPGDPKPLDAADRERLVSLSTFTVRARSAVERDGYTREIELVPEPEAPSRLVLVLCRLLAGLDAIGLDREQAWPILTKVSLDSVPALRLLLLAALRNVDQEDTSTIAARVDYPRNTAARALEDLAAHKLVKRHPQGQGKADLWALTQWTRDRIDEIGTFPETSGGLHDQGLPETSEPLDLFSKNIKNISGKPPHQADEA